MSRNFDLATGPNYSINSVGSLGSLGNGAYTIITLFNINTGNNNCGLISFRTAAINAELFIDGNQIFGAGDFGGGQTGVTVSTWWWAAIRKAAGSSVYTYSLKPYASGSATHQNSAASHADSGATNTTIRLGDSDDRGNGLVAVLAAWTSRLSDAQVAGMFTSAASDIAAQSPGGLWLGNQASSTDPINDSVGTANQTSVNGAIGVGSDPPAYNYSLSGAAVASARPPLVTSISRPVPAGQQVLLRNTAALIVPSAKGVAPIVVGRPGLGPAAVALLRRGALADPPVLTTVSPSVTTRPAPPPAAAALLLRGSLVDTVLPNTSTPGPIVVTFTAPPSPSAAILLRTAPTVPPGQQPMVVATPTAPAPAAAILLRASLADTPVLTTVAPLVVTTAAPPFAAAAIQLRNAQPAAVIVSGPTTAPIVITQPGPPPAAAAVMLRSSLLDVPVATPGPTVVTSPAPVRPSQPIVTRGSLADFYAGTEPLIVTTTVAAPRGTALLGRNPQPFIPPVPGPTTAPIVVTAPHRRARNAAVFLRGVGVPAVIVPSAPGPRLRTSTRPALLATTNTARQLATSGRHRPLRTDTRED